MFELRVISVTFNLWSALVVHLLLYVLQRIKK